MISFLAKLVLSSVTAMTRSHKVDCLATCGRVRSASHRAEMNGLNDNDQWQDSFGKEDPTEYKAQGSSLIECLFYPNLDSLSGFKWTGPDSLPNSTRASDISLHTSALLSHEEVHWIEILFVRFDRVSGDTIGEDLFFLPQVETAMGNLYRIHRQLLDTIIWHAVRATGTSFRLSLWRRTESVPYSSLSTHSLLTRLPLTLSLDPRFFVHNISSNYE
jgi:hypothetical protein